MVLKFTPSNGLCLSYCPSELSKKIFKFAHMFYGYSYASIGQSFHCLCKLEDTQEWEFHFFFECGVEEFWCMMEHRFQFQKQWTIHSRKPITTKWHVWWIFTKIFATNNSLSKRNILHSMAYLHDENIWCYYTFIDIHGALSQSQTSINRHTH